MKKKANPNILKKVKIHPQDLNFEQPLARFMISLFNLFEDEIISSLSKTSYKEVTRTDLNAMRYIDAKGLTATQLAKFAGISKQAMSKQIEDLTQRGYVRKVADIDDGRIYKILFTDKGVSLINYLIGIIKEIEHRYERKIGKSEYLKLKTNLKILIGLYEVNLP